MTDQSTPEVHFAYATYRDSSLASRVRRAAVGTAQRLGSGVSLVGDRTDVRTDIWPARSPYSVTHNVYSRLRERLPVRLYDLRESVSIHHRSSDILLGHPFLLDQRRVWDRAFASGGWGLRIAMTPLSYRHIHVSGRLDQLVPGLDAVFGIMGRYWGDTWQDGALAHWAPKLTRLDMAVDAREFPFVKRAFNPPGKRRFLYIGNDNPDKGLTLLSILFGLARTSHCTWIGAGRDVPNLEHRDWRPFTSESARRLAEEFDFLITMGTSDANPTTILEAMAWGLPVCCTPQSGYYRMPEVTSMSISDMSHNLRALDMLQDAAESDLLDRAKRAREVVERDYSWDKFFETFWASLRDVASQKGMAL
jgi:glycosyltransferase involved in cell wall biosynthesis